jgi:ADP-ribose pyrophosphatase YjhB (NUDIX family)
MNATAGASFVEPAAWFASLPTVIMAAGALITDPGGQVLLVKPNYRDGWALPGGICEQGEAPHEGCDRELLEELGLVIPAGRLLIVNWAAPEGARPKSIMHLVFDGGTLRDGSGIRLQREELDEYRFFEPGLVTSYLPAYSAPRVAAALHARATGTTVYLPSGEPYPEPNS